MALIPEPTQPAARDQYVRHPAIPFGLSSSRQYSVLHGRRCSSSPPRCGRRGTRISLAVILRRAPYYLYKPVLEDWLWFCIFPLFGYLLIVVSAGFLVAYPTLGLFGVGSAALVLLFVGIHNAWDSATFIAIGAQQAQRDSASPATDQKPQ